VSGDRFLHPKGNLIDGQWQPAVDGRTIPVEEPATGERLTEIPRGTSVDIDLAVTSARKALDGGVWSQISPSERSRVLWRLAELVRDHAEDLAHVETRDTGKPIAEAREDVAGVADITAYFAGAVTKLVGQTLPLPGGQLGVVLREPIGVVGAITPWNFPMYVAAWKVVPALACGNTVVLKPSSLASLTCLGLGELALEAGLPPGALNVVCGTGDEAGTALAGHTDVDLIAFTGSTEVGRAVMAARAKMVRPIQVELGGKSPNIIFADADFDKAVAGAAFGIFYAQGENCNAGSRVLVEDSIHDRFLDALVAFTERIRVLPPTDERSQLGSLISAAQLERVSGYVDVARSEGARVVTGGHQLTDPPFDRGHFYAPTVLADVRSDHRVFQEEIFGPVVTITSFRDEDEAIRLGNATEYGLAAGVWTSSVDRAMRCSQRLASGYVWINTFNTTPVEAPFGGVKSSGFGRDCGLQAIENYTTWKTVAFATEPYSDWYGMATAADESQPVHASSPT
jgi:acyl-CoA reductase-like NAD-dependent aldehyde dehydrogenase